MDTQLTQKVGVYSEYLPKELGFYSDPYSDFGRLAIWSLEIMPFGCRHFEYIVKMDKAKWHRLLHTKYSE